jgi:hypothetical protein
VPTKHEGDLLSYPQEFLGCRIWGHAWNDKREHWSPVEHTGWDATLPCSRCGSERTSFFDKNLVPYAGSKTVYADGYLFGKGNRYTRTECRVERVRRITGRVTLRAVR